MEHGKPFSATDSPLVDFDAVCQKVRAAVEPARAYAVSLHDEHGDVLWLSESSMGPDEHNAVREAVETFSGAGSPPVLVHDLGESRSALLLRAVNGQRVMVGVIMLVLDARVVKQDARGALKVMTPKLQRALAEFAAMEDVAYKVVHFNNGMHGWTYSESEYKQAFPAFLTALHAIAPEASFIWASTTPVKVEKTPGPTNARVEARNSIALTYANKAGIPLDDQHELMSHHADRYEDDVHFNPAGAAIQGQQAAQFIRTSLAKTSSVK